MNYRHAFHAGNFADVHKHAVLALILTHLREKPTPFRLIDTHAGAGLYDLAGPEATQTAEWRNGVARVLTGRHSPEVGALLAPYLDAVASFNGTGAALRRYPGSPLLARALLREDDRLLACEIVPEAQRALAAHLGRDARAKAIAIDGWTALGAYVPPKERRGLVVIDPPYEAPNDVSRVFEGLRAAHRKWPAGIYLVWYPVTGRVRADALAERFARSDIPKALRAEIVLPARPERLGGSGLAIVNPPWRLPDQLATLLPALLADFAGPGRGEARVDWLTPER